MRLAITLNLGSRNGSPATQIIADHPAKNLREFASVLKAEDFIIVEEIYLNGHGPGASYQRKGELLLGTLFVGRVRPFTEDDNGR